MSVTLEVSKEETSREAREERPSNMENMWDMPVTCEVSKEETSREAREEQSSNI